MSTATGTNRNRVLAAMIFAVAMTFIDQTILSIAVPEYPARAVAVRHRRPMGGQRLPALAGRAVRAGWAAVGHLRPSPHVRAGRDHLHRRVGAVWADAQGPPAEAWIVAFRVVQGAGGALMFPAALAIVVRTFPLRERGRALAMFFGIAGGLTAIGPILGGYLTQWTWRAIFWVNVPVAILALMLIVIAKPTTLHQPARMDFRGTVLIAGGVALSVFGLQQSAVWGWSNPGTGLCIAGGVIVLVVFYFVERRTSSPLIQVDIFRIRPFLVENVVLAVAMMVFLPVFFFASEYAQLALGKSASEAGLLILFFFLGFVVAAQIGGGMLDRRGAKPAVVLGCALSAVGFWLWAGNVTQLNFGSQRLYIILAGAGMGLMLGPAQTDAVNRASKFAYGEATGITQTVRNYAGSLGLAVLGTILVSGLRSRITTSLIAQGLPSR